MQSLANAPECVAMSPGWISRGWKSPLPGADSIQSVVLHTQEGFAMACVKPKNTQKPSTSPVKPRKTEGQKGQEGSEEGSEESWSRCTP